MYKKMNIIVRSPKQFWILVAFTSILVLATACGSSVISRTPTTTMGSLSQDQQLTETAVQSSMQTSGSSSSGSGTVLDICSLVSSDEAATVLGQAPIAITPGSEPDSISGSTLNFCTYLGSGLALVFSSVETGSANAGAVILQAQLANMVAEEPATVSTEEPGLGIKAYWSVAANGVSFTVLTDTHVFSVGLGGNIGDSSSHKATLLDLARSVASKQ